MCVCGIYIYFFYISFFIAILFVKVASFLGKASSFEVEIHTQPCHLTNVSSFLLTKGDDTMTGDGGEYLRAEDLRELGDDSLPGQYLDGMNYLRFSLEGGRTDRSVSR